MSRQFRGAAAALVIVMCAGPHARAGDVEDIKQSGQAFAKAMQAGDAAEAHKYAVTDDQTSKVLDVWTRIVKANQRMSDAAAAKFGDEGKRMMGPGMSNRGPQQVGKDMDNANIQVNGDTATVASKDGRGQPVTFKKDSGVWKLSLPDIPNKEQVVHQLPMMETMATAMSETGDEITAGKYKSVMEARQAFGMKMAAAMGRSAPGAPGAPAAPPAPPAGK